MTLNNAVMNNFNKYLDIAEGSAFFQGFDNCSQTALQTSCTIYNNKWVCISLPCTPSSHCDSSQSLPMWQDSQKHTC